MGSGGGGWLGWQCVLQCQVRELLGLGGGWVLGGSGSLSGGAGSDMVGWGLCGLCVESCCWLGLVGGCGFLCALCLSWCCSCVVVGRWVVSWVHWVRWESVGLVFGK